MRNVVFTPTHLFLYIHIQHTVHCNQLMPDHFPLCDGCAQRIAQTDQSLQAVTNREVHSLLTPWLLTWKIIFRLYCIVRPKCPCCTRFFPWHDWTVSSQQRPADFHLVPSLLISFSASAQCVCWRLHLCMLMCVMCPGTFKKWKISSLSFTVSLKHMMSPPCMSLCFHLRSTLHCNQAHIQTDHF